MCFPRGILKYGVYVCGMYDGLFEDKARNVAGIYVGLMFE